MTNAQTDKLWTIIAKLEALHSPKHKNDTAIEDMERAKTSLLTAYHRGT